jgi:Fe-S-cluster containining protein
MDCLRCGACCTGPDIAALDKPLGVRCPHLGPDRLCSIYERRPQICRDHKPDEICLRIQAATLEERARKYLELFGLEAEARRVGESGETSMRRARRL